MNKHITHPHPPQYDNNGNLVCCTLEEKIDGKTPPLIAPRKEQHHEGDGHDHSHDHAHDHSHDHAAEEGEDTTNPSGGCC